MTPAPLPSTKGPSNDADTSQDVVALAALRAKIDAIDESMHNLLIQRGTVIDQVVAAKGIGQNGPRPGGAAFRPAREAAMMRAFVARHSTDFPLTVIEHIWREIIGTFTHLQAPYQVHVDGSQDAVAMQDMARFHFGFSVALAMGDEPEKLVERVRSSGSDLALISLQSQDALVPWWNALGDGAMIMARLPFINSPNRPYSTPSLVIAPPLSEPDTPDYAVYSIETPDAGSAVEALGTDAVLSRSADHRHLLVALPSGEAEARLKAHNLPHYRYLGGYAAPIHLDAEIHP